MLVRTSSLKGFFVKCEIYEDCGYMTASSRLLFPVAEVCVRSLRVLAVRQGKIVNKLVLCREVICALGRKCCVLAHDSGLSILATRSSVQLMCSVLAFSSAVCDCVSRVSDYFLVRCH